MKVIHDICGNGRIDKRWLYRPEGRTFNNLSIADTHAGREELRKITGRALMEDAARAGARIAVFDSKSQWYAFHNTRVSEKHPGLGKRDLVAELVEAGRKLGVIYVPYLPPGADCRAGREHPDWMCVDASGKRAASENGMYLCCQVGPFRRFVCSYLEELCANYDIGGVWFDGAGAGLCYCDVCRRLFREKTGLELPAPRAEDAWKAVETLQGAWGRTPDDTKRDWPVWVRWMAFRDQMTREIVKDYADAMHRAKPGLPVIADACFHGWIHGSADLGPGADLVPVESLWSWTTAQVQVFRAAAGYRPTESYLQSAQYAPNLPLSIPEQQTRVHAMTSLASGGLPMLCLFGPVAPIATVTRELRARAPWTMDAREIPYAGVVWSERSRNLHDRTQWAEPSLNALYGTVRILLEEKIPECAVTDRQLEEDGGLDGFRVLVLPDIGTLTPRAQDNLRAFVRAGGGLVATFRTSLADPEFGEPLSDFALADMFGVHYAGQLSETTTVRPFFGDLRSVGEQANRLTMKLLRLADHPIVNDTLIREANAVEVVPAYLRGRPADYPLAWPDPMLKVRATTGVRTALHEGIQEPGHTWPMISTRTYGRGRVVYIAAELGRQYNSSFTWPYVRRLLANAVRWAAGSAKPPFRMTAPLHVQATLFRQAQKHRQVLHLLNDPNPKGLPPFRLHLFQRHKEEVVPIFDIPVALRGRFKKVYLIPERRGLRARFSQGYTHVTVPRLDTHLMVVGVEAP